MTIAILVAGGESKRFGRNKLSATIHGISILKKTVQIFLNISEIQHIIVVISKTTEFPFLNNSKITVVKSGKSRFKSFKNGIEEAQKKFPGSTKVLVHNGANPGVSVLEILEVQKTITSKNAVGVGKKITGTIRKYCTSGKSTVIPRENIWEMETPQGATLQNFKEWIDGISVEEEENITDELCLAEKFGVKIIILPASISNKKITTPEDLEYISKLMMPEKISGIGVDSHRFQVPEKMGGKIGGIEIFDAPQFLANSDGDVLLHALCNALLSSVGKGSFSRIADPLCKAGERNSAVYIQKVLEEIATDGIFPTKISATLEGKRPKLEKHFPSIKKSLSEILNIPEQNIGLNATTGEDLDEVGQGKGIRATVLVECQKIF